MNKKIKIIISIFILIAIIGINISYAINVTEEPSFFEISKTEIEKGETLEITLNLSKIDYEQFEITLNSNTTINEIYTNENNQLKQEDIILDEETNNLVITIDKTALNLDKMVLYYQIPEKIEQEKIELNSQILITKETEKIIVEEEKVEILIKETENKLE